MLYVILAIAGFLSGFLIVGFLRGFCPKEKCPHYGKATKYPRKCYYEPQCFWGDVDALVDLFRLVAKLRREK